MKKKILSIIIAMTMAIGAMPVTALAMCEVKENVEITDIKIPQTNEVESGGVTENTSENTQEEKSDDSLKEESEEKLEGIHKNIQNNEKDEAITKTNIDSIYVSEYGNDSWDGTEVRPYATLAKAVDAAPEKATTTIIVMSDIVIDECVRVNNKKIIVKSSENNVCTVSRGKNFDIIVDNERVLYNPAMIECSDMDFNDDYVPSITLENIVLDDCGLYEGQIFGREINKNYDKGNINNIEYVQDAIVAAYDGDIILDEGAALKNFGGMSAVHITGDSVLTMKNGSIIVDDKGTEHGTINSGDGAIGAIWCQGAEIYMEDNALIKDISGRGVYMDSGYAKLDGDFLNISKGNYMKFFDDGIAISLRNGARAILGGKIIDSKNKGASLVYIADDCDFTMDTNSAIKNFGEGGQGIYIDGNGRLNMDGEITGLKGERGNAISINGGKEPVCIIGPNGYIHDNEVWDGTIYMQSVDGTLDIYGRINNNNSHGIGGAMVLANECGHSTVTMFDGAEIIGNTSDSVGAGIHLSMSTFIMQGGTISDNYSKDEGAGVYVFKGGTFTMNGGEISNNNSGKFGGGIAYSASDCGTYTPKVEINAGTINDNYMNVEFDKNGDIINKTSNDLAIDLVNHSYINRYFQIKGNAKIGNTGIYMVNNNKLVKPIDFTDFKIGNAKADQINKLTDLANKFGCEGNLKATFFCESEDEFINLDITLLDAANGSVCIIAVPVDAYGNIIEDPDKYVITSNILDKNGKFNVSLYSNSESGYLMGIFETDSDFGKTILSVDKDKIKEDKNTDKYNLKYTIDYKISEDLANYYAAVEDINKLNDVTLDLKIDEDVLVKNINVDSNAYEYDELNSLGSNIKLKLKPGVVPADFKNLKLIINVDTELNKDNFEKGKVLSANANIYLPHYDGEVANSSNVVETLLVGLENYVVTFDLNGGKWSDGSDDNIKVTITDGDRVDRPKDPKKVKYDFSGWYNENTGEKWDFTNAIEKDTYLIAKWSKKDSGGRYGLTEIHSHYEDKPEKLEIKRHESYISGYPDGTVRPTANITRAEVASIVYRLIDDKTKEYNYSEISNFYDVKINDWYCEAISTLTNAGILHGDVGSNYFRPNDNITRAEFATIISCFERLSYVNEDKFIDIAGHWANKYINSAAEKDWIKGYPGGIFCPDCAITRAEVMTIVNNMFEREVTSHGLHEDAKKWRDNNSNAWYYYEVIEATNTHEYMIDKDTESEQWVKIIY